MFEVLHKVDKTWHQVYFCNGVYFLFYDKEDERWYYDQMANYEPLEAKTWTQ